LNSPFAWLLVRMVAGFSLAYGHGLPKAQNGAVKLASGLAADGWPLPHVFAWCATLAELVGGVLVAIGLLTRPAAAAAAFTMFVALYQHRNDGFVSMEKALLFAVIFVAATIAGSGRWGLDAKMRLPGILGRLQR
jgi:putative oxidoreductase